MSDTKLPNLFQRIAYKVVYPFWPKEMRELIEKYKEEGTLNLKGVYYFSERIFGMNLFLFVTFIALIPTIKSIFEFLILSIAGLIAPTFSFFYFPKNSFRQVFSPYICGKLTKVKVKKISYNRAKIKTVLYINPENSKTLFACHGTKVWEKNPLKVGDEIIAYVTNSDKYGVMPDIKHAKEYFSLTTTIINKESNHAS